MTVGTSSWDGLGMGLFGEYEITQIALATDLLTLTGASSQSGDFLVGRDSSGTEKFFFTKEGKLRMNPALTGSEFALDVRATSAHTSTGTVSGIHSKVTLSASNTAQNYAGWFNLITTSYSGGREAVLNLQYNVGTSGASNARSFINFGDGGSDPGTLFTFPDITPTSGGCFETVTCSTATHGLVMYVGSTKYWIMCCDSSKE